MANGPVAMPPFTSEENQPAGAAGWLAMLVRLILVAAALAGLLLLSSCRKSSSARLRSEDALTYAPQVELSDLHLSAEENFLGQQVVYLDGKMTNRGPRVVRQLKVTLFFRDILNQVVLREDQGILDGRAGSLNPGQERSFQIRFDQVPDSWNRQVPQLQIISLQIQQP